MLHLTVLDGAVVVVFLMAVLGLGFSAKLRDSSVLQFLAAGRMLTLPAFVATLVSTWYGGILGVGESVKFYGVGTWLLLGVPYYVFAFLYAVFLAKRVRGGEEISIPERLAKRWGKAVGILAALLVFLLAAPAAHVLMLGVLVRALTHWDQALAVWVATLGGSLFLYKGGLLADVRAGMLAFLMMYVGFALICVFCLVHFPPAAAFSSLDRKLFDWTGGGGWTTVLGFFALGAWTLVDPGFHQRVASAATPRLGRKGVFICIGFWFLFDVMTTLTGLYALALVHPAPQGLLMFPALGDQVLPSGLRGIFLCGMLGTILCAMVAYTLVSGATLGREVLGRLVPTLSENHVKMASRVGFLIACLVAVELALGMKSVVDLWYQWGGTVIGALLIPVCASYIPKMNLGASRGWIFWSMALSFAVSFSWLIYGKRTHNDSLVVYLSGQSFALGTLIPGAIVSAIVLSLGQIGAGVRQKNV